MDFWGRARCCDTALGGRSREVTIGALTRRPARIRGSPSVSLNDPINSSPL
ncbi:BZ3500_MvSof-1268-A1-R1_Chr12-1g03694 [Microbotryum saponariae]|uniref:BZ3500_MvSof-1268-A1-R1_Chr12-1g03694 protein n=1 Tax=Microbotryum saponariae TaxID=289078 RepID=A0A2X0KM62_9BASI|nr:BZ3500_MvSof-1268-A1-R1_Chr12-1g03694 [Microbotryum saponariae]SDA05287.1 BZ3501_MvSof-1269-A2-R1_Chr12-1g03271 [Microbotryum saponariae]